VRVVGPPFGGGVVLGGAAQNGGGARKAPKRGERKSSSGGGPDTLPSPLQGNMWKVLVKQGDEVQEGQLLCIIEAMKMENEITAHKSGKITELPITEGAPIQAGAPIATIVSTDGES
jgi:acetyl-CoA/propionyl-CoA carboxylase biotin carboxyl carrier protein